MEKTKLHPGARWHFRFRAYGVLIAPLLFVAFFVVRHLFSFDNSVYFATLNILVLYFLFLVIIGEIFARMSYNRFFYEFTHDALRIERGIIWKRYSNVPYERVQNVDIFRGIIARLFGFSTLMIHTAGYASSYGRRTRSEGYIPAVSVHHAEEIRDFLMKKISKRHSKSGL